MRFSTSKIALVAAALLANSSVQAIVLNTSDSISIRNAASTIAYDMMKYYTGNLTGNSANLGLLPSPYYWWESGAMFGAMVDYWYYTGDTSYNEVVAQAILSQASPTSDFMMPVQHFDLGNDDQVFWALTAMSAAEYNFPNPSSLSWVELAANVFDDMSGRWNTTQCNGGLKWQIFPSNAGYDYKSSIANGGFFQLAARLARYTGNQTYVAWAEKTWNWVTAIGLVSDMTFNVYDGSGDLQNCTSVDLLQWSYNNAIFIYGSAMIANISGESSVWRNQTSDFLLKGQTVFFSPFSNATDVMFEAECERTYNCDTDQFSFKAYLSRWYYATAKVIPELKGPVLKLMRTTALAAAQSCSGGSDGRTCGTAWWTSGWDGTMGVGQQMSALEAIQGLLLDTTGSPGTAASLGDGSITAKKQSGVK